MKQKHVDNNLKGGPFVVNSSTTDQKAPMASTTRDKITEKYHSQMKEAQQVVAEKTSSLEAEAYKTKRLQEEIAQLKRKVDRMKKIELAETLDEVMVEELREYKETLTCPSCKVKRKDAVLTKCFHVFCWDCLRTRYETRQRKCPKCNCAFGANDYHRLYLST
ncbi:E3 ubiquitin-protein ligase bre1 [Cotesia glomerata]|uniref:E3 ubiquitin protein ligase n=1 Tax=Cotesia glomerata TaxID=32391 RepID=A0AAV7IKX8_COTGL|nr:E3 ubiquitin-protein ligase bre1 [Cotesia glomerata]